MRASRGNLNRVRVELDAMAHKNGGRRVGLFNKRWLLPNDSLADVIALIPQAQIDPKYREALERYSLSFAKDWSKPTHVPDEFGITLYPFQEAAIAYLLRAQQVVLGDEAGVGKTFAGYVG